MDLIGSHKQEFLPIVLTRIGVSVLFDQIRAKGYFKDNETQTIWQRFFIPHQPADYRAVLAADVDCVYRGVDISWLAGDFHAGKAWLSWEDLQALQISQHAGCV
jgi:hypothetical protein